MQQENAQTYRPENGERGDGREPPQGRNGIRGKRSMAEEWRPPEQSSGWCWHSTGEVSRVIGYCIVRGDSGKGILGCFLFM